MRYRSTILAIGVALILFAAGAPAQAPAKKAGVSKPAQSRQPAKPAPSTKAEPARKSPGEILQERFENGQKAEKEGDLFRAESEYRTVLGRSLAELGSVYESLNQLDRAELAYSDASESSARTAQILLGLGTVYLRKGEYEKGVEAVEKLLARSREHPFGRSLLGKLYLAQGKVDLALEEFQLAQRFLPDDLDLGLTLAAAYLRQKQVDKAQAEFARLLQELGESVRLRMTFGLYLSEHNFFVQAMEHFRRAIALDPNYPRAHYYLGLAGLADGIRDTESAIREFREELSRRPDDFRSNYLLGLVYVQERMYKEGIPPLEKAIQLDAGKPDPYLYLGQAHYMLGEPGQAELYLLKAIELSTDPSRNNYQIAKAHYWLGQYYARQGKAEEAKRHTDLAASYKMKQNVDDQVRLNEYLAAGRGPSEAERNPAAHAETPGVIISPIEVKPEERERMQAAEQFYVHVAGMAANQLGLLYARRTRFGDAARFFAQAERWTPNLPDVDYNLGLARYRAENYAQAIAPLEKARQQQPDRAEVLALLGMSYFFTERYSDAGPLLTKVAGAEDQDPQMVYALALCHAYAGNRELGVNVLRELLQKYPAAAVIHMSLGRALALDGDYAGADGEFARAQELDPKLLDVHYYRGLALLRQSKYSEAAGEFRAEFEQNPRNDKAAYHLGFSLQAMEQLDEAARYLGEAIRLNPAYADAYYELGKARLKQGNAEEAVQLLEKSVTLGNDKSYVQYQLSQAYLRAGKREQGQAAIEKYQVLKAREQAARKPPQMMEEK